LRLGSVMRKSVEIGCPSQTKSSASWSRLATRLLVLLSSIFVIIESAGVRMSMKAASSAPPCLSSCRRPGRCSYTHSMPRRRYRVHDGCELVHFVLAALQARHDGVRTRGRFFVWRQYSRCRFLDDSKKELVMWLLGALNYSSWDESKYELALFEWLRAEATQVHAR
jgi:hypothetical protein